MSEDEFTIMATDRAQTDFRVTLVVLEAADLQSPLKNIKCYLFTTLVCSSKTISYIFILEK